MTSNRLSELHNSFKEKTLFGRYINSEKIEPILKRIEQCFDVSTVGFSVENRPVYSVSAGNGPIKVLLWSQMHGNESTTTKAIFDLINVFSEGEFSNICKSCTLLFIPILNPDGAEKYTRVNANGIDLNRDAQNLSQPESRVLRQCFNDFLPHYCFNLHGQRTIFGVGNSGNSATLSFLSPSEDNERSVTETRTRAMSIIASVVSGLQVDLPNAIGRYDDDFNINCVGDTFQSLGVPTILYEAGHYNNDYMREVTRLYIFKALFYGLNAISTKQEYSNHGLYFKVPENEKNFFDVIVRNALLNQGDDKTIDVAIQFKETLINNVIAFIPCVEKIEKLDNYFAHDEIDAKGAVILDHNNNRLKVTNEIDFVMLNNRKILIKS
ncbi:M14 family metallopeptidase [Winogradskyella haliclonae]|uniref:Peptidase M14 n=1 Tax=Winogradskyella haliclonae TaxID=2048558 RepID=A0ABQ2BY42_9FLAO|nr:M14 metallopeptidase family protein [Winogradskyella haliclonae]GGI57400.1 peptidase M14 [Winogradskyella haliclonae]